MNEWIITDTHFGHSNLVSKGKRVADYEKRIRRQWGANVRDDDLLIHLGDVAFGPMDNDIHRDIVENLPGIKWLVMGNHDSRSVNWYLKRGWNVAAELIVLEMFGERICFSHKPQSGKWFTLNIHGHCHLKPPDYAALGDPDGSRHHLVSLELQGYGPKNLASIIDKKRRTK